MTDLTRAALLAIALVVAAAGPRAAHADDGHVLALDGDDIYIDLGAADGVGAGATIDLRHEVVVRDPVTKEVLRDQFTIGQLTVLRSGDEVSVARAPADLKKRVRPGDRKS